MKSKTKRDSEGGERVLQGLGVSAGIAIGTGNVREGSAIRVPDHHVAKEEVEAEQARFAAAVEKSRRQLAKVRDKAVALPGAAAEEAGYLLDAHLRMLSGSRLVRGVARFIAQEQFNAAAAVQAEVDRVAKEFADFTDPYLAARMQDIRDVGARLLRNLTDTPYQSFATMPEGTVIVAEELTPADTALMDPKQIVGLVTMLGGPESHTAIMARSLGLPAVLGVAGLVGAVATGATVIVDGAEGKVVINPTARTRAAYERRRRALQREQRQLDRLRPLPSVTRDNHPVNLFANTELPGEVQKAFAAGAAGIGLLRSEFMFMNRPDLPGEEEQYEALRAAVLGMQGRPVTVRTLDIGGDKLASSLDEHRPAGANPALGLRAIRLSLKVPKLLETQLAAILRAGAHGPLRILLPMISSVGEVRQVRAAVHKVAQRLRRRGARIADPLPPIGVMIEIPGAALAADSLAQVSDFFAIGTNDLVMYTLAIDRGDEQVAHLYNPLHPAVLRLLQFTASAAMRARIPVSLCGEMAGDPRYAALLLGLGIHDFSMAVGALARVKQRIRALDLGGATQRAMLIMDQTDPGRIATLLDDFNALG